VSQPYLSQLEKGERPITVEFALAAIALHCLPATALLLPETLTDEPRRTTHSSPASSPGSATRVSNTCAARTVALLLRKAGWASERPCRAPLPRRRLDQRQSAVHDKPHAQQMSLARETWGACSIQCVRVIGRILKFKAGQV